MNSIAQERAYRLSLFQYANRHGVTQAARKYHVSRQFIYRLRWRYTGDPNSLLPRSRRPHHHPSQHTKAEISLIQYMRRRHPHDGLVVFWVRLRRRGYTRSIPGLYRCMRRLGLYRTPLPNPKRYEPKPYAPAHIPGEKIQIDVKVVPRVCIVGQARQQQQRFYQYTAIDECTRWRCLAAFPEQSTYSSAQFLEYLIRRFPFPIQQIQTDNGAEFTKRFNKQDETDLTVFEQGLRDHHIAYHKIRPYTPRHNGKVERSHRKDNEYFYSCHTFYSLEDFRMQLARRNREYNAFPMKPLGWKSPNEVLRSFSKSSVTDV